PNSGQQGQTNLTVALVGAFTSWANGTTTASFGAGITVNGTTVSDATHATANLTIADTATLGARAVSVTTGAETVTLAGGFAVLRGTAVLTQVTPNSGQ